MKTLKNSIKSVVAMLAAAVILLGGCKKDDITGELSKLPSASEVQFTATPTTANPNILNFKSNYTNGISLHWDLGNGGTANGTDAQGSYPQAGTYVVKLTVLAAGGSVTTSKTVTIANTNPAMLDAPEYTLLSGGLASATGKTWVIDQTQAGHLGVGPITSQGPDWYQAGPDEKNGTGFYDDEMTFKMSATGLSYTYDNKGTTFANASNAPGIGGPTGANDPTVNYTPGTNWGWILANGGKTINISNGGFISYYLGVSSYQILSITADEMYLRCADKANAGNAWYLKLIRKGYTRPIVQKPMQAANMFHDFDAGSNFTWGVENMTFKTAYDNPLPLPVNTSAKVGYYEKLAGDANQYGNLNVTMPYRFDLTAKNKVRLKVYIPGANDYTKVANTVAVKLQNSLLGGNSWQTQIEIKKTIAATDYNKWIQLEFDFSGSASQTLYDKVVLQLGGEGHPNPGIFFIDDFEFR